MTARQRLRGSLGDSWGDADYDYDSDQVSVHSASDSSDSEDATPLPVRATRRADATPSKTPTNRTRHAAPQTTAAEPSLIMPTLYPPERTSPLRPAAQPHRRPLARSTHSSQRMPASQPSSTTPRPAQRSAPMSPYRALGLFWQHALAPVLGYLLSVFAIVAEFTKPLVAVAAIAWLAYAALRGSSNYVASLTTAVQTSVCIFPGSSLLLPALCARPEGFDKIPDFEAALETQDMLRDIVADSKDAYQLPSTMKSTEGTLRDLRTLVKYSTLPSRAELDVELTSFIEASGETVHDLTRFNARVGFVLDQVISTNSWTSKVLHGLDAASTQSGVARLLSALTPFSPGVDVAEALHNEYIKYVAKIKEDIGDLIVRAQALDAMLAHLDAQQQLIYELAVRDGLALGRERDQLFAQLWTKLGGNRNERAELGRTLALIRTLHRCREQAARNIRLTVDRLLQMQAGLETLRDGVAAPGVVGHRGAPLGYHIEVIDAGVRRLQEVRGEARALERGAIRGALDGVAPVRALPQGVGEMPVVYPRG